MRKLTKVLKETADKLLKNHHKAGLVLQISTPEIIKRTKSKNFLSNQMHPLF
jgi:hypothetical protein